MSIAVGLFAKPLAEQAVQPRQQMGLLERLGDTAQPHPWRGPRPATGEEGQDRVGQIQWPSAFRILAACVQDPVAADDASLRPMSSHPTSPRAEHETVDYIVVGGGSAGCVLAARLTEDPDVGVLLLEAGPPDQEPMIKVPAAFAGLFRSPLDWTYEIEPQERVGGSTFWPRGRTLGGSSSINLMIYARGVAADYDGWAAAGCTGWDFAGVLPYFVRAEHNSRLGAPLHGTDGPLYVEDRRYTHELSQAWVDAAVDAGLPRLDDLTGQLPMGVGSNQVTCRDGRRWSAADAYLRPALDRPNLTVRTGTQATRVLFDGLRATGVAYRQDGVDWAVTAEAEVLICGGSVNSPQLLLLSGVGPADRLREHGIDDVVDLPGVGENLHDHPFVPLVWTTRRTTDLRDLATPENMALWQRDGSGPFTSNGGEVGGFVATDGSGLPNVQLVAGPTAFIDHGFTRPPMPAFTGLVGVVAPRSRGRLMLRSADPLAPPRIDPAYYADPADLAAMTAGLRVQLEIAGHAPLAGFLKDPYLPDRVDPDDDALVEHVRRWNQTEYHPVGTCAMGVHSHAVVDLELRVRGTEGLRVVDASVMPIIPRANTNAPTIMVAEKAADLIRGRRPPE